MQIPNQVKKNFIIEGNIGSGKTTLLQQLGRLSVPARLVHEPVDQWVSFKRHNLLKNFYNDQQRWAFALQQLIVNTMVSEYVRVRDEKDAPGIRFFERSPHSTLRVFGLQSLAANHFTQAEYDLVEKCALDQMKWVNYDIAGVIYVKTAPEVAQQRAAERRREEDAGVQLDYLCALHALHEEWLTRKVECPYPVLTIINDASTVVQNFDAVKDEILAWVLNPDADRTIDAGAAANRFNSAHALDAAVAASSAQDAAPQTPAGK